MEATFVVEPNVARQSTGPVLTIKLHVSYTIFFCIMTSSNGIIFRVSGHLCGEFPGHRGIPLTKASDAEL